MTKYEATRKSPAAMNVVLRRAEAGFERSRTFIAPTPISDAISPTMISTIGSVIAAMRCPGRITALVAAMAIAAMTAPT